jgi:hypothetical protein
MRKRDAGFHHLGNFQRSSIIGLLCWYSAFAACQALAPDESKPLPDLATLMQSVEDHQKASEALIKNYIYTSTVTQTDTNASGHPKKTETTESEVFYVDNVRLTRLLKKNGKELDEREKKKETERIDNNIAKARERRARGESGKKHDEVSFARFLELGSFTNERRLMLRGRPTIAVDFTGDPKAKTHNPLEGAIHELAGTVWVDEQDQAMSRVEGHFANNFKIGGGLLIDIKAGTSFWADSTRVNDEVWLPAAFAGQGSVRAFLFFNVHGSASGTSSNYRKFKSGATIVPGIQEVEPTSQSPTTPPIPQPQP